MQACGALTPKLHISLATVAESGVALLGGQFTATTSPYHQIKARIGLMGVYIQDGTLFYLDPESPVRIPHFLAGVLMDWVDVDI